MSLGADADEDEPTGINGLREHPLNHLRRMSAQQGLDVPHRLIGDVEVVLHPDDCVKARRTDERELARQDLTFLASGSGWDGRTMPGNVPVAMGSGNGLKEG